MDFHFLVMQKSWKINVEKEGAPWGDCDFRLKSPFTSETGTI